MRSSSRQYSPWDNPAILKESQPHRFHQQQYSELPKPLNSQKISNEFVYTQQHSHYRRSTTEPAVSSFRHLHGSQECNTGLIAPLYNNTEQRPPGPLQEPFPNATDDRPSVNLNTAELAEFASTMVYLMWHVRRQAVMDLHATSKHSINSAAVSHRLNSGITLEQTKVTVNMANMTSATFKKYCRQVLKATQLSESVILLSLKYIAMLLQNSPNIQGADGSEYRLFTVALMLANKFLDDNTFTNKTWSEVSGMKVMDLNIMEMEFLDVLHFRLTISKEEYERWRTALYGFRDQLLNCQDLVTKAELQRQKLIETMAISTSTMNLKQHQHQQQGQQQHNYYLFNNNINFQQSCPPIPAAAAISGSVARVPLRIPSKPLNQQLSSAPTRTKNFSNTGNTLNPYVYSNATSISATHSSTPVNCHIYKTTTAIFSKAPAQQQNMIICNNSSINSIRTSSLSQLPQQQRRRQGEPNSNSFYYVTPTSTPTDVGSKSSNNPYSSGIYNQQQAGITIPVYNKSDDNDQDQRLVPVTPTAHYQQQPQLQPQIHDVVLVPQLQTPLQPQHHQLIVTQQRLPATENSLATVSTFELRRQHR